MTKNEFTKYIKELVRIKTEVKKVEDVIRKSPLNDNLSTITFASGYYENLILNLLKDAMNDTADWIVYWLYELDCGKKANKKSVQGKDGESIPIKTISNLYDLIIKY
jgi:actin-related protein